MTSEKRAELDHWILFELKHAHRHVLWSSNLAMRVRILPNNGMNARIRVLASRLRVLKAAGRVEIDWRYILPSPERGVSWRFSG